MRSNSLRSSSRFFSLFGGSFSRRWERPPPTYDEAMKHVNPDLQQRPPDPPPYSDSFRARFPLSRSLQALRSTDVADGTGGTRTPPPDYTSCEDLRQRARTVGGRGGRTTTGPSSQTEGQGTPLLGMSAEEIVAPLLSHRGSVT